MRPSPLLGILSRRTCPMLFICRLAEAARSCMLDRQSVTEWLSLAAHTQWISWCKPRGCWCQDVAAGHPAAIPDSMPPGGNGCSCRIAMSKSCRGEPCCFIWSDATFGANESSCSCAGGIWVVPELQTMLITPLGPRAVLLQAWAGHKMVVSSQHLPAGCQAPSAPTGAASGDTPAHAPCVTCSRRLRGATA